MALALSPRQSDVLEFIRAYRETNGESPTIREIGAHLGIRSTNGVDDHLRKLEAKGYIERPQCQKRRNIVLLEPPCLRCTIGQAPSSPPVMT